MSLAGYRVLDGGLVPRCAARLRPRIASSRPAVAGPSPAGPSDKRPAGLMCSPSNEVVEGSISPHFHSAHPHPGLRQVISGDPAFEGLQMNHAADGLGSQVSEGATGPGGHRPVMVGEVLDLLGPVPPGLVLDATVGGGGHAEAILEAHPHLSVLGVDRDPEAVERSRRRLARWGRRAEVARARFDQTGLVPGSLSGALFDLGVSSEQLDTPGRGFSYRFDAPLDMRMDPTQATTAADLVNGLPVGELTALLAASGEERWAGAIARRIVAARPLVSTSELAAVVAGAVPPGARRRGNVATRVFQALRIAVNDELEVLERALGGVIGLLVPRGRVVVLSYHSGEDRRVKAAFTQAATGGCTCPPGLPCVCGAVPLVRILNRRARRPGASEVQLNPRSAAARLRAAERLGPGEGGL